MENIKKRILLLSTGDINGAYEAIYKLASHFEEEGHQVAMLVKNKTKSDAFIYQYKSSQKQSLFSRVLTKIRNELSHKIFQKTKAVFDTEYDFISIDETQKNVSAEQIIKQIGFTPEFIFTGMTNAFMNSTDLLALQLLTKAQVYNITVDMNHFTGGCHYAWDCKGYINGCNIDCPAIVSEFGKKTAKINFETKLKNAQLGGFKIIAGSGWTLKQAKESKIYKDQIDITNVNSLIDTKILNNKDRSYAKNIFGLKKDKFYILMGCQNANQKRKGFEYLLEALKIVEKSISEDQKGKIEVLIVSRQKVNSFEEIPFGKKHIDYIKDYRLLALLYQATDVFVNSSIEDAGPMMVSEALACGTPVVGFDMGVVNNMVVTGFNGYKAKLKDSNDLAQGIKEIFELSKEEYNDYSLNAVKQVENFSSLEYAEKVFDDIFKN